MELRAIWVYPLKSAGGVSVDSWGLETCGLVDDRRFMLVDGDGNFVSQRTTPHMARLRPQFCGDSIRFNYEEEAVEFARVPHWQKTRMVEVWGDRVPARCAPAHLSAWFSGVLKRDGLELVWFDPTDCLLYTSPSPRDKRQSRMPSSA